jgi:beta-ureidopropionase / N-carbamoyl-L-amino-acid hydrolase
MDIRVDLGRLKKDIEDLGGIGRDPRGGISRPSFSRADLEARAWLKDRIRSADLELRQDGAGNIFGRWGGPGQAVMAGSHIDTVVNGGMFDGSCGVLAALECLRRVKEEKLTLSKPLELASFTDEEGNLVGDFLGSRAFLGGLKREDLEQGQTQIGPAFKDILAGTEFTLDGILAAGRERPAIEAYLELHIEQGPVLETEEVPIGLVDRIAGKRYRLGSFVGTASHAGTTPLELRQDAFLGLAEFAIQATRLVASGHEEAMVTIGKVGVLPGSFSIVPGRADFSLDFRSASAETLRAMEKELLALAEDSASARGLSFGSKQIDATEPVIIPDRVLDILKKECEGLAYPSLVLPSGAGHDAQILAAVTDAGMIFIPSIDGLSHSPQEAINWDDLEKGANLLLHSLIRLAQ